MNPYTNATTAGSRTNIIAGLGTLSVKVPYSAVSWTAKGYSIAGASLLYTPSFEDVEVPWSTLPVDANLAKERIQIQVLLAESALADLRLVLPGVVDLDASEVAVGRADRDFTRVGVKLVGPAPNGLTRTVLAPYGRSVGTLAHVYTKGGALVTQFVFGVMDNGTDEPLTITDA